MSLTSHQPQGVLAGRQSGLVEFVLHDNLGQPHLLYLAVQGVDDRVAGVNLLPFDSLDVCLSLLRLQGQVQKAEQQQKQ